MRKYFYYVLLFSALSSILTLSGVQGSDDSGSESKESRPRRKRYLELGTRDPRSISESGWAEKLDPKRIGYIERKFLEAMAEKGHGTYLRYNGQQIARDLMDPEICRHEGLPDRTTDISYHQIQKVVRKFRQRLEKEEEETAVAAIAVTSRSYEARRAAPPTICPTAAAATAATPSATGTPSFIPSSLPSGRRPSPAPSAVSRREVHTNDHAPTPTNPSSVAVASTSAAPPTSYTHQTAAPSTSTEAASPSTHPSSPPEMALALTDSTTVLAHRSSDRPAAPASIDLSASVPDAAAAAPLPSHSLVEPPSIAPTASVIDHTFDVSTTTSTAHPPPPAAPPASADSSTAEVTRGLPAPTSTDSLGYPNFGFAATGSRFSTAYKPYDFPDFGDTGDRSPLGGYGDAAVTFHVDLGAPSSTGSISPARHPSYGLAASASDAAAAAAAAFPSHPSAAPVSTGPIVSTTYSSHDEASAASATAVPSVHSSHDAASACASSASPSVHSRDALVSTREATAPTASPDHPTAAEGGVADDAAASYPSHSASAAASAAAASPSPSAPGLMPPPSPPLAAPSSTGPTALALSSRSSAEAPGVSSSAAGTASHPHRKPRPAKRARSSSESGRDAELSPSYSTAASRGAPALSAASLPKNKRRENLDRNRTKFIIDRWNALMASNENPRTFTGIIEKEINAPATILALGFPKRGSSISYDQVRKAIERYKEAIKNS